MELEDVVSGLVRISEGEVLLGGRSVTPLGPAERRRLKMAYVPADRMRRGSPDSTMTENMIIVQREDFLSPEFLIGKSRYFQQETNVTVQHNRRSRNSC